MIVPSLWFLYLFAKKLLQLPFFEEHLGVYLFMYAQHKWFSCKALKIVKFNFVVNLKYENFNSLFSDQ
mgnify:CR=1 FL=1